VISSAAVLDGAHIKMRSFLILSLLLVALLPPLIPLLALVDMEVFDRGEDPSVIDEAALEPKEAPTIIFWPVRDF